MVHMTASSHLDLANKLRKKGKKFFHEKQYESAVRYFSKALEVLDIISASLGDDARKQKLVLEWRRKSNIDTACCLLKMKRFKSATDSCYNVLIVEPKNIQACYMMAQGLEGFGKKDMAKIYKQKAVDLENIAKEKRRGTKYISKRKLDAGIQEKKSSTKLYTPSEKRREATDISQTKLDAGVQEKKSSIKLDSPSTWKWPVIVGTAFVAGMFFACCSK